MSEDNLSYFERLKLIKLGQLPKEAVAKTRKPIAKKSEKKKLQEKNDRENRNGEDTELQKWYGEIMKKETPICWETGEAINPVTVNGLNEFHGSIAHILSKALYPSVATHPKNYVILKMWGGTHGQYDSSFQNASKMGIWKYCCEVIAELYPLLTQKEKAKLPNIILVALKLN